MKQKKTLHQFIFVSLGVLVP